MNRLQRLILWLRFSPPRFASAALLFGLLAGCAPASATISQPVLATLTQSSGDFARVDGPRPFSFPADQGAHNDFQTEWWYYTGNLDTSSGRHFGFQLTFFRRALVGPAEQVKRASTYAADQVYMAHFTLTDVSAGQFHYYQRLERGAAGLAGATGTPQFSVWLDDWRVDQTGQNQYHLHGAQDGIVVDLELTDLKGIILQGDQGYSQKGSQPGNASYYYSMTRLETKGNIQTNGEKFAVSGLSWMDHEWSTSALSPGEVGWDWFGLQLSDGSELMLYTLRHSDGSLDPYSSGTLIAPDGSIQHLKLSDFNIQVERTWRSPNSGAVYPAAWKLQVPSAGLDLEASPYLADQELRVSFTYWEGAVRVQGTHNGQAVSGSGYVELTGYAASMQGQF
jgi:predicted secreted hydrolase